LKNFFKSRDLKTIYLHNNCCGRGVFSDYNKNTTVESAAIASTNTRRTILYHTRQQDDTNHPGGDLKRVSSAVEMSGRHDIGVIAEHIQLSGFQIVRRYVERELVRIF